jgi:hypothetical protein
MRAVIRDGHLAGSIASFPAEGRTEVTYIEETILRLDS